MEAAVKEKTDREIIEELSYETKLALLSAFRDPAFMAGYLIGLTLPIEDIKKSVV